jgi:hypothetical protein
VTSAMLSGPIGPARRTRHDDGQLPVVKREIGDA